MTSAGDSLIMAFRSARTTPMKSSKDSTEMAMACSTSTNSCVSYEAISTKQEQLGSRKHMTSWMLHVTAL